MHGLVGKTVAITGGAGDIGLATAKRLAEEGAVPFLLDIVDMETGKQRCKEVNAAA